jgi:ATP-dependent protease ClpP protease subunit
MTSAFDRSKRIMNLERRDPPDWFSINNSTRVTNEGRKVAEIYIYDRIGGNIWGEGTTAQDFVDQLKEIGDQDIDLHLNSPGGLAFDGIAIKNALRQHSGQVNVIVDGLAASAASIVAMGGDHVAMEESSQMMIHNASGIVIGNKSDMRQLADDLDKMDGTIAEVYHRKAGGELADWKQAMEDESWYTADEAVKLGLADVANTGKKDKGNDVKNNWDLSIYMYAGRQSAPEPRMFNTAKNSSVGSKEKITVTDKKDDFKPPQLNIQVTNGNEPKAVAEHTFKLATGETSDYAAVQAYVDQIQAEITQLKSDNEAYGKAQEEAAKAERKNFVQQLSTDNKILASEVEDLQALVETFSAEQFTAWKNTYDKRPAISMFANHGQSNNDPGKVENKSAEEQEWATVNAIIDWHRKGGRSEEFIQGTESWKRYEALKPKFEK